MKDIKKITKIAENLGWNISIDGNDIELGKYSPAGQDFVICETAKNLKDLSEKLLERYDDFDVSEETYKWLDDSGHGTKGAPYDMKDVYEDMEACKNMILELQTALALEGAVLNLN